MAFRVRVGDTEIAGLLDRQRPISPEWHYPDVPAEAWEPYREMLLDEAWSLLELPGLPRARGRARILIDTGWGPGAHATGRARDAGPPGRRAGRGRGRGG